MKTLLSIAIILSLTTPSISLAAGNGGPQTAAYLRARQIQRLRARIKAQTQSKLRSQNIPSNTVRVGSNIITRRFSPRRLRSLDEATVVHVADGSVLQVQKSDGALEEVRLLGADAPAIVYPSSNIDCYAKEAKNYLRYLVEGKKVRLIKDDNYRRDSYRRELRYVQVGGRDVGSTMIRNGYAFVDRKHSFEKQSRYYQDELEAREDDLGIWSFRCDYEKQNRESIIVF